jgi:hypothetical protein
LNVAPFPFQVWAVREGYDIASALLPAANRTYADRQTQAAFDAFNAGAMSVAVMVTESTIETEALRERIKWFASCE